MEKHQVVACPSYIVTVSQFRIDKAHLLLIVENKLHLKEGILTRMVNS
jgi:hypothetical protein